MEARQEPGRTPGSYRFVDGEGTTPAAMRGSVARQLFYVYGSYVAPWRVRVVWAYLSEPGHASDTIVQIRKATGFSHWAVNTSIVVLRRMGYIEQAPGRTGRKLIVPFRLI